MEGPKCDILRPDVPPQILTKSDLPSPNTIRGPGMALRRLRHSKLLQRIAKPKIQVAFKSAMTLEMSVMPEDVSLRFMQPLLMTSLCFSALEATAWMQKKLPRSSAHRTRTIRHATCLE